MSSDSADGAGHEFTGASVGDGEDCNPRSLFAGREFDDQKGIEGATVLVVASQQRLDCLSVPRDYRVRFQTGSFGEYALTTGVSGLEQKFILVCVFHPDFETQQYITDYHSSSHPVNGAQDLNFYLAPKRDTQ